MSPLSLLLVDDDPDHRRLLLETLRADGPQARILATGRPEEFIRALKSERFDCVLIDFSIPPTTAPDLIRQSRSVLNETPVIVLSSSTEQHVVIESFRTNVADYLPKSEALLPGRLWNAVIRVTSDAKARVHERRKAARRVEDLNRAAETDALTGLFNRRRANRILESPSQWLRNADRIAMILLDIDHFKSFNDQFGHLVGDRILMMVADSIRATGADGEAAIRWGGDEILILSGADHLCRAWARADLLRNTVARQGAKTIRNLGHVGLSVGISLSPSSSVSPRCIWQADRALYLAKSLGRNRIFTWPMVELFDAASAIGDSDQGPVDQRINRFLGRIEQSLGKSHGRFVQEHSAPACRIARLIGSAMGLTPGELLGVEQAAAAHDLGKCGIPEDLLGLPRRFSEDERAFVRQHARFGADLAAQLKLSPDVVDMIASHLLPYDQRARSPVRSALSDKQTSIVTVAAALAAMTSARRYAEELTPAQALAELDRGRGGQFDPQVVETCKQMRKELLVPSQGGLSPYGMKTRRRGPCAHEESFSLSFE